MLQIIGVPPYISMFTADLVTIDGIVGTDGIRGTDGTTLGVDITIGAAPITTIDGVMAMDTVITHGEILMDGEVMVIMHAQPITMGLEITTSGITETMVIPTGDLEEQVQPKWHKEGLCVR